MPDGRLHDQKIALTAISIRRIILLLARTKPAVPPTLSDRFLDAEVPGDDSVFVADGQRRRRYKWPIPLEIWHPRYRRESRVARWPYSALALNGHKNAINAYAIKPKCSKPKLIKHASRKQINVPAFAHHVPVICKSLNPARSSRPSASIRVINSI